MSYNTLKNGGNATPKTAVENIRETAENTARKNLVIMTIISAAATSVLGVLSHFAYDFFNQNPIAALFFPINESAWEHLKLLFFPMLLCLLIMSAFYYYNKSCYITGISMGLILGCISILALFYAAIGIIGRNIDWLNIVIYFISVIAAHLIFYYYAAIPLDNSSASLNPSCGKKGNDCNGIPVWIPIIAIIAMCILFFIFSFYQPDIALFQSVP